MNSNKNNIPDISHFRLSLADFLRESHPERLKDGRFILACTESALDTYEQAIRVQARWPDCSSRPAR